MEIPGIGEKTAEKVLATANDYLAAHPPAPVAAIEEYTPEMEADPGDGAVSADAGDAGTEAVPGEETTAASGEPGAPEEAGA